MPNVYCTDAHTENGHCPLHDTGIVYNRPPSPLLGEHELIKEQTTATFVECLSSTPATDDDDTITLVLVVCLFIFCNTMGLGISLIESSGIEEFKFFMNYLVDISNLLVVTNSSVNVLVGGRSESYTHTPRADLLHIWQELSAHIPMVRT
jgi:hypothetical protein